MLKHLVDDLYKLMAIGSLAVIATPLGLALHRLHDLQDQWVDATVELASLGVIEEIELAAAPDDRTRALLVRRDLTAQQAEQVRDLFLNPSVLWTLRGFAAVSGAGFALWLLAVQLPQDALRRRQLEAVVPGQ